MSSIMFSSGTLFAKDPDGYVHKVGILQDVSLDLKGTTKQLRGGDDFPVAVATGGKTVTGKVGFALIDGLLISKLFGGVVTTGRVLIAEDESVAIDAQTHIGTVANAADFEETLYVLNASGARMTAVQSNPAAGVSYIDGDDGTYTFHSTETGPVTISYRYTVGTGSTVTISNGRLGTPDTFSLHLQESYEGKTLALDLFAVVVPSLSLGFKNEEFATQGLDFEAFADATTRQVAAFYVE